MKRTALCLLLFTVLTPLRLQAAEPKAAAPASHPNVLFILCDDLRWDALGCAGNPYVRTPNIDRLAAEGCHFANTFCTTSLCSPSRASILSGLYAHAHGVLDNFTEYPKDLPSFPRSLQAAGYETAYIGKWHMGEMNDEKRPGFDYFVTHKGQGKYFDTEFNVDGKRETLPGYYTHVVTGLAQDWLKRPLKKPWLMMLGHKAPHSFYFPEPKYAHAFDNVEIRYPESAFHLQGQPEWIRQRLYTWHGIYGPLFEWRKNFPDDRPEAVKDFAAMTRAYWGTILSVDDSVGQLYQTLEKLGQLDNTIIVFMGDNGLLEGEHGMVDKRTAHEPSLRIPLLVRYPGLAKGKVIQDQALTIDVAPSLLELCGAKPLENIHGKSWVKLVREGDPTWRKSWFYEYNFEKQFPYTPNVRAIRTNEWKYIHYPNGDGSPDSYIGELYNEKTDPDENYNLIKDLKQAPLIEDLKSQLLARMKETGLTPENDKMPVNALSKEMPDMKIR
jgi:N-acetylglucosamine-6-sulfatase